MSAWGSAYLGYTRYACMNIPRHSPIEVVHEGLEEFANRVNTRVTSRKLARGRIQTASKFCGSSPLLILVAKCPIPPGTPDVVQPIPTGEYRLCEFAAGIGSGALCIGMPQWRHSGGHVRILLGTEQATGHVLQQHATEDRMTATTVVIDAGGKRTRGLESETGRHETLDEVIR
jgi:hypothetical protein